MTKKYKYVNDFKKLDPILRYSSVDKGMTRKEDKQYKKSDNTLILDKDTYFRRSGEVNYTDLKTLIIAPETSKNEVFIIDKCSATSIYIKNNKNLGDITIPFDYCLKNKMFLRFIWNKIERTKINKVNIVFEDFVKTIESDLIEIIEIDADNNIMYMNIKNHNSLIHYEINELGEVKKEYETREIYKEDINNNILDLREFQKYKKVSFNIEESINFDKLIINKNILKNINKFENIFNKLNFNKLQIIDDDDMKLLPKTITIETKNYKVESCCNKNFGNILKLDNEKEKVTDIVYIDKKDNVIFLNDDYLKLKYDMKEAKIDVENYLGETRYLIIMIDNNDNFKVLINEKIYEIDEEFKNFILLNSENYFSYNPIYNLRKNNWFEIIGKGNFNYSGFLEIYNEYLNYKKRLKKLKELGLSVDAIKYLIDRKIHSIINTETEEGLIDINDINKFEIDLFNKIGEEYKKVKKL